MKKVLVTVVGLMLAATAAFAQPQIAYMIPDIGAAGMNTYVEIVAPAPAIGTYGGNGQFVNSNNGTETIGIGPANIADTARIVVGPIVVSWEARLISTQIFVKPGAANGVVPLRVTVSGSSSTVDFEIVTPRTLGAAGTVTGGGVLGSGGALGTRSKRGAMIVNSVTFDGGTYSVSTADPDPATPGNQGYLPFILISKGSIAIVNGAVINVNAGTPNGGPGGGGGGGAYCDRTFFGDGGPGSDGGDGFAGGGAGGRNSSSGGPSSYRNPGNASGASGASMNGVAAGGHIDCNKYESSGGGTGHPFGLSGLGPCFPTSGRYGGGSAADQNTGGGGGGYGTAGANGTGSTPGSNGGQIVGNAQGVPVAGGSAGASGNPRSGAGSGICSGSGGGGGGALVMYASTLFNNTGGPLAARGAAGGNGSGPTNGGSGSGGYIGIGAKVRLSSGGSGDVTGAAAANGGGAGGAGRGRYDGFLVVTPAYAGNATPYVGPTIDTLSYVQTKTFTVQGTKGADAIQVWMRGDNTVWQLLPAPTVSGRTWSLPVTVPSGGNYYFVAMQVVSSPSTTQYRNEPGWVMSQSAANMVRVDLIPQINVDRTSISFPTVLCSETPIDSVKVFNTGDDTLRVLPRFAAGTNFSVVPSLGQLNIPPRPGDTVYWIKVRFNPGTPGLKTDTLILQNNDPRPGRNPIRIVLTGRKANIQQSLSLTLLDFGDVCRDSTAVPQATRFSNAGDTTGQIKSITRLGSGTAMFSITQPAAGSLPLTVAAGGNTDIRITFKPTANGAFVDSFRVVAGPCDSPFVIVVRGRGVTPAITLNPNPVDFGNAPVNVQASVPVTVTNSGTIALTIKEVFFRPAGVAVTASTTGLVGTPLAVGANASGTVLLTPLAAGTISGQMCLVLEGACRDTFCFDLQGTSTIGRLVLSRTEITMEADSCNDAPPVMVETLTLYNRGNAAVRVDNYALLRNLVNVTSVPSTFPMDLAANDSVVFTIRWTPTVSGVDTLTINTQAQDPAQRAMKVPIILRRERSKVEALTQSGGALPSIIDFGTILDCSGAAVYNLLLRSSGTINETMTGGFVVGGAFSVNPALPISIPAGADRSVSIVFSTPTGGVYNDTLVLRNAACNREIRIPVTAVRAGISISASGIAFGNTNVGVTRRGTATITNTSSTPNNVKLNIKSATVTASGGTPFTIVLPTGLPKALAPGEAASVDVDFLPTAEIGYNAQICFEIDSPCDTTVCVPLSGSGVKSSILVRLASLNFGTRYICQDDSLGFSIVNSATTLPLTVDSIRIVGTDAGAFEIVRPTGLPLQIAPQDSILAMVRFVPSRAASDGLKSATLEIYSSDLAQPIVRVTLVGERRRQSLATPTQLDFGTVEANTSVLDTVTLENRTAAPMQLTALDVPAPFVIVSPSPLPVVIGPLDSIKVVVRFTPVDSVAYNATLVARQSQPCADSTLIAVAGKGKVTPVGLAEVAIETTLSGRPGDRLAIPILLRNSRLLTASGATTFQATLRFRKSLLLPLRARAKSDPLGKGTGISVGNIISKAIDGDDHVVTVEITNNPMPTGTPDTLGFLDVEVMLGDTTATPIAFDTLRWTDATVVSPTSNGAFTLVGYCTVGGNRLLEVGTGFGIKAVTPNPFNSTAEIVFQTIEQGPTTLALYDLMGRRVVSLIEAEELPTGPHVATWNASDYPSGIYLAVLTSSTQRTTFRLMLAK